MEPMLVCALGIVVYCAHLTVKDTLGDFRREGLLAGPLPGGGVARRWKNCLIRLFEAEGVPRKFRLANSSFICRPELSCLRQHQHAASRIYRPRLG